MTSNGLKEKFILFYQIRGNKARGAVSYRSVCWSVSCGYQYLQCIFNPSELTKNEFWSAGWSFDCSDETSI